MLGIINNEKITRAKQIEIIIHWDLTNPTAQASSIETLSHTVIALFINVILMILNSI
jgi:hypothetical protein